MQRLEDFLKEKRHFILLVAPGLLGALVFLLGLPLLNNSIQGSELAYYEVSKLSFGEIIQQCFARGEGPIYYILLKIWTGLFGQTDYIMRMPSLICAASCVLLAFLWLKYKFSLSVALGGGLLLAFSPVLLHYAALISPVILVGLLFFASLIALEVARANDSKLAWTVYIILAICGLYTWLGFGLILMSELCYFVVQKKSDAIRPAYIAIVLLLAFASLPLLNAGLTSIYPDRTFARYTTNDLLSLLSASVFYQNFTELSPALIVALFGLSAILVALMIFSRKKLAGAFTLFITPIILSFANVMFLRIAPLDMEMLFCPALLLPILAGLTLVLCWRKNNDTLQNSQKQKAKSAKLLRPALPLLCLVFLGANLVGILSIHSSANKDYLSDSAPMAKQFYAELRDLNSSFKVTIKTSKELYDEMKFYEQEDTPLTYEDIAEPYWYADRSESSDPNSIYECRSVSNYSSGIKDGSGERYMALLCGVEK